MGRVLLVDHDWFAREPLALFAQSWSHEVEQANDAAEALEKLTSFRPHVMVTNRGLPGPDGEPSVRQSHGAPHGPAVDVRLRSVPWPTCTPSTGGR